MLGWQGPLPEGYSGFPVFPHLFDNCYELYSAACSPAVARSSVSRPAVAVRAPALVIAAGRTCACSSGMAVMWGMGARPELYDPAARSPQT